MSVSIFIVLFMFLASLGMFGEGAREFADNFFTGAGLLFVIIIIAVVIVLLVHGISTILGLSSVLTLALI